ncbi:MAG: cytochrome c peroxidase [Minicystis sp.]
MNHGTRALTALWMVTLAGCGGGGDGGGADDAQALSTLVLDESALPAAPTNKVADDAQALSLGRRLFFDKRMSSDGKQACVSCHDPQQGFSDPRPVSLGVGDRKGHRHSMPITDAALHPFLFWDGRADSAWSQPLKAIEGDAELDFTRVEVAHLIADRYRPDYEALFGPLPDLADLPARARPGMPAWDALSAEQQDRAQRVFANVGKALEAYERKLLCADTRFDRWQRGEIQVSNNESDGAAAFQRSGCTQCHNGPSLSDGQFHDLGLDGGNPPDLGRKSGITLLLADPFNGEGAYSDDKAAGAAKLGALSLESATIGAFRTASLRGVGQRQGFGHLGSRVSLREFILDTYRRGGRGGGGRGDGDGNGNVAAVGTLDPALDNVDVEDLDAIVAFLHTLDCPALPAELLAP